MPDSIRLDPETEDAFRRFLHEEAQAGRYGLEARPTLKVPETSTLFSKLKPYIDADQGGLKVLEIDVQGAKATFSIVPRIDMMGGKVRGAGVGIGFTLKW